MAGPWEQYQQPVEESTGPWAQYQQPVSTGVDAIPGQRSISQAEKPESLGARLAGLVEIPAAAAAGALTSVAAPLAGIYGTLTSGKFGTPEGIRAGQEVAQRVQQWAQPQTRTAQEAFQAAAPFLEAMGAAGPNINAMNVGQSQVGNAARVVGDRRNALRTPDRQVLGQTVQQRNADFIGQRVAESNANAPLIDGAKAAQRVGFVVDPSITNPTKSNKIKGAIVGPQFDELAAEANSAQTTKVVRKDLGIADDQLLDQTAVNDALDKASAGYDPIRKMEALAVPDEAVSAIEGLRKQAPIGGEAATAAVNKLIDETLAKLQETTPSAFSGVGGERTHVGRNGAMILNDIRTMRQDAQAIYKAQKINPDPLAIASADTKMAISKILEDIVDANAPNPKALSDMRKARTRMAQIYDHDLAIDYANQTVDPQVYAKLLNERKGNMTGVGADIGKAAATFPNIVTSQPPVAPVLPTVKRSGVGAAIGAVLGGAVGNYPGAIAGAGAGAAAGSLGARSMARNMLTPEYQAARAMPVDYRPAPNNLRPADINYGPNQMVPYDFSQQTFTPPNFVMQGGDAGPRVSVQPPQVPSNALGYNPNVPSTAEVQMSRLRAEDVMDRNFVAQRVAAQEAQQAAAEAAARQPTRGGQIIDIDPVTGKMVLGAEGTAGMTPDIQVIESTGSALASAARKIAGAPVETTETKFTNYLTKKGTPVVRQTGQTTSVERGASRAFDLTAEERIAWNKTRAEMAEVMPELKKLDDKEVVRRMTDVKLAQEAVDKARQKAQMFDEMAKRMESEQAKRDAAIKRDQMLDLADMLEDNMRAPRPVSSGGQGPKTREFRRNQLAQEREEKNMLRIDITGVGQRK